MPDHRHDLRHRRRAAVGKLALTIVAVAAVVYVLAGFLLGAFDDALQGLLP